ncbi:MAG: phytanoyl-CoA dioxygenase family protein, partial [Opitutaceae bacterium]
MSTATPATPAPEFDLGAELHAPELYQPVPNTAHSVATLDDIGPREIAFYREHGYLAVREAFTPTEVSSALSGLVDLIMGKNPAFNGITFEAAAKTILPTLSAEQRQDAVRKAWHFVNFEPRLKAISHHAKLWAVAKKLIGDKEPEMFQDMALVKPPRLGREKPWHQDHAY